MQFNDSVRENCLPRKWTVCSGRGKNVAVAEESDTGLRDRD